MKELVLSKSSLSVKLEGEHLVIHDHANKDAGFTRVPLAEIERVVICGQPAVSFRALAKLMDLQISCGFMTHGGRWRGVMDGDAGFHADRRRRQYESMSDNVFRLAFAGRVIEAKLKNSRRTLQRLAAKRNLELDGISEWEGLDRCIKALPFMRTIDSVRGLEGVAAANYFRLLSRFFPKETPFVCRTRRPPGDPANSLLSFLYTLLENEVVAAARTGCRGWIFPP